MARRVEELIGGCLMVGLPGAELTPEIVRHCRRIHAGGVILFRRNFKTPEQLVRLLRDLEEALQRRLLVAVDHEGGRVAHFAQAVTFFPGNLALGQSGQEDDAFRQGAIEARELRRLGIDLNLSPCADVLTGDFSPNIGIRAYGSDPVLVAKLVSARIRGMQENGLSGCAKHFPGQGSSPLDAHLDLPVLDVSGEELEQIHLLPFRAAIEAGVDSIMSSHPVYPKTDAFRIPATFSGNLIRRLLREEMKFHGVILSDDLEMGALRNFGSAGEAAVRALKAGHDMVLICRDLALQEEAFLKLCDAVRSGELDAKEMEASAERLQKLKSKRPERFAKGELVPDPEGQALAASIARRGIQTFSRPLSELSQSKVSGLCVIFPKLSSLDSSIAIEKEMLDEEAFIKKTFQNFTGKLSVHLVGITPSDEEIAEACKGVNQSSLTVFFCFDARLGNAQRRLLEQVQQAAPLCAAVLLRDPYDRVFIKEKTFGLQAFGFRKEQILAAAGKILSFLAASRFPASNVKSSQKGNGTRS